MLNKSTITEDQVSQRVLTALKKHAKGYNCAQAVSCAFCDVAEIDEKTMFRITEGLGLGMGGMNGTCGAIAAAAILSGIKCSTCNLESPDSKASSYSQSKECMNAFLEKNGSVICRELKGIDSKKVLRSCNGCIEDAVRIIENQIFSEDNE